MSKLNYEHVFNTLVEETAKYILRNNLKAMVLGISGGIDSTIVAAICCEVNNRIGIPLIGRSITIKNTEKEYTSAGLVGEAFCNNFKSINLHNIYSRLGEAITTPENSALNLEGIEYEGPIPPQQTPIANGNIQARLRMIYLYNIAGINKGIVMDTDNLTEHYLGFFTIHGDMGDFNPIGGLWKTEVYGLAKWLVEKYKSEAIINDAGGTSWCNKAVKALEVSIGLTPTDGLGISNSDLDQIGAKSYEDVDTILKAILFYNNCIFPEKRLLLLSILYKNYTKEVVGKIWNRYNNSDYKRKKLPIVIKREAYE